VSLLAIANISNILSYSDTLLLTDTVLVETIAASLPIIMDSLRSESTSMSSTSSRTKQSSLSRDSTGNSSNRKSIGSSSNSSSGGGGGANNGRSTIHQQIVLGPQRFYTIAALANATAHPRLAEVIKVNGGNFD
jgi:hypothetical protein